MEFRTWAESHYHETIEDWIYASVKDYGYFVYLLIDKDTVVYVGQTRNMFNRAKAHMVDKIFDRVAMLPIPRKVLLNEMEAYLIVRFQPKYNNTLPKNCDYATKSQMFNELGISRKDIFRLGVKPAIIFDRSEYYDTIEIEELLYKEEDEDGE